LCYWAAYKCGFFRAYGQRNGSLFGFVDFIVTVGEVRMMKWIEKDIQACFPVYKCSNCGAEILVFDAVELPCYCKNCGEDEEK
jgi:hypothetical protein